MIKISLFAMGAVLSAGTAASADFVSFEGNVNEVGDYTVIQMFAVYDTADIALNVFNAQIVTSDAGGFNQSDVQIGAGDTWAPNASLDIPGFADSATDSYVTIGYGVGAEAATNGTSLDPGFGTGLGGTIPSGAGWFNGNPPAEQGVSGYAGGIDGISGYAVMVGQFVWTGAASSFCFDAKMGSNAGAGSEVDFGEDTFLCFCPTPGALALLGLGGFTTRRRRG